MINKKRIAAFAAGMAMAISLMMVPVKVNAGEMNGTFTAGSAAGAAGDTVTIPITLGGTGIRSGKVNISFDEDKLQLTEITGPFQGIYSAEHKVFSWMSLSDVTGTATATFKILKCSSDPVSINLTATYADSDNEDHFNVPGSSGTVTIRHSNLQNEEKAPTCTESGYKKVTCGVCNEIVSNETIPALGHDEGTWKIVKEATCGAEGSRELHCTRDGALLKTEVIPATGKHNYEWKVTKEATCKADGEKTGTCSVCGDKKAEKIPATGKHNYEWKVTKEATCKADGEKTGTCSVCGDKKTEKIPATGKHNYEWKVTKEATCTEKGEKTGVCSVCGEKKTEIIPASGHDYKWTVTKEATCTEKGEKTGICSVCKEKKTEEINILSHKWTTGKDTDEEGWKVVTAATKEKEGSKERVCSLCGKKETAVIAKLTADGKNPTTPKTPAKTESNKTSTTKNSVKTGDESMLGLYAGLLAVSAGAAVAVKRRKKQH